MRTWLLTSDFGGARRLVLGVETMLLVTLCLLAVQTAQTFLGL